LKAARKKRTADKELDAGRFVCCLFVDSSHALTMRITGIRKPTQKAKAANIPSGLASNWQSKLSAAAPRQTPSAVKASCKASVEIGYPLGGLEDEDAFADVPGTLALTKGRPMATQKNDVCCFHI
jgi:hypothetical protein